MDELRNLTPQQIKSIEFFCCAEASEVEIEEHISTKLCDAGCGTLIAYLKDMPIETNKVCLKCAAWLVNCEGNA